MKSLWVKNTNGKKDAMLTFAVWAFALVFLKVLFGGNEWMIRGYKLIINPIDATMIAALLTPTLGAYVARRNGFFATDAKTVAKSAEGEVEP